jgi:hypothetical protein
MFSWNSRVFPGKNNESSSSSAFLSAGFQNRNVNTEDRAREFRQIQRDWRAKICCSSEVISIWLKDNLTGKINIMYHLQNVDKLKIGQY